MDAMTELPQPLLDALGVRQAALKPLAGGDLSEVQLATLDDGREMVVKTGPSVDVEARMLSALALLRVPVPKVLHAESGLICLEYLAEAPATREAWRDLGQAVAQMHSWDGADYGWQEDYFFDHVEIFNTPAADWPAFWAERRLLSDPAALPADLRPRIERLAARLSDHLPKAPKPSLLHGDLWSGNLHFAEGGAVLIDPACYHGHSEVDLAMLTLFGQPDDAFWRGYGKPEADWETRRPIYQLWPALVHLRLFGGGYHAMVAGLLDEIGV